MTASASEKGIHEVSFAQYEAKPREGYRAQNSANAVQKRASTYTSTAQPNRTAVASYTAAGCLFVSAGPTA